MNIELGWLEVLDRQIGTPSIPSSPLRGQPVVEPVAADHGPETDGLEPPREVVQLLPQRHGGRVGQ